MSASSDSDEETFVELGKQLPLSEDDRKKSFSLQDSIAKDAKGHTRFHGAFTGGFSAGYFNSVGSKEGWVPSTFVSSRTQKTSVAGQRPEDFMDEEDFGEHGIAPRTFAISDAFTSEEKNRKRRAQVTAVTRDTILPAAPALIDLIIPERAPIGIRLLCKMGWREGQGIGPRSKKKIKKKQLKDQGTKVYGCKLPSPNDESDSKSSDTDIDLQNVTFAPKDVTPISLTAKDNVFGLGYHGIDPRSALSSPHISLFDPPPVKAARGKKGIRGQAFGVGALEEDEDDDDIYAVDSFSNYDQTMEIDDSEHLFGWTAPRAPKEKGQQATSMNYVGKLLEGFTLSAKLMPPKKVFPPPTLPQGFNPFHKFKKSVQQLTQEAVGETHTAASQRSAVHGKMNAIERGLLLGETPVATSVFDLIPKEDISRMEAVKEAAKMASNQFVSAGISSQDTTSLKSWPERDVSSSTQSTWQEHASEASGNGVATKMPLFQGSLSFKPFRKDPAKQDRYDQYLALVKQGVQNAYEQVTSRHMMEWERQREREEFAKAAKIYRPLSSIMASRFTRGAFIDDVESMAVPTEHEGDKSEQAKAAGMKMFGRLTREEFEWYPHNLLCKRFNVPNPYPGSEIVGLRTAKKDKISIYNFLSVPSHNPPTESAKEPLKAIEPAESKKDLRPSKRKGALSIFQVLEEDALLRQSQPTSNDDPIKTSVEAEDKEESNHGNTLDVDLFRAIFKNSDSESSSASSEISDKEEDEKSEREIPTLHSISQDMTSSITGETSQLGRPATSQNLSVEKSLFPRAPSTNISSLLPSAKSFSVAHSKSHTPWGASIFDVLDTVSPPHTPEESQTAIERQAGLSPLSPDGGTEECFYGPALPPELAHNSCAEAKLSTREIYAHMTEEIHKKHKHKHQEKGSHTKKSQHKHHEKKKKSKHKKLKKKKGKKKSKKQRIKKSSSGSDADTETDSASDN